MSDYDNVKNDLTLSIEQIISDYELDVDVNQVTNSIKRLVNALVYLDEDFDEDEDFDSNSDDDFITYRDDIDDFFGE